jgi:hypothetical protein
MAQSYRRRLLLAIYITVAIYLLPIFPHGSSANELTRWATAASLVEKGSFEITWTEALIGRNVDTARVGDKTYSNKAPGTALLAAPFYAIARIFTGPPDASHIRITWDVMRLALSTLPLFLLALWLYRQGADEIALGSLLFATPLFLYSPLFFSHVFVAIAIYVAYRLLYDDRGPGFSRYLWAGALSGLAVISEFPSVFAVAVFGAGLLFTDRGDRFRRVLYFVLGGTPFLAVLLIYNYSLFGSPFSMSYAHESFPQWAEVAGHGFFGIGMPSFSNAFLLLFSPARGLLFYSPILIFSIVLLFRSRERITLRHKIKIWAVGVSILLLCGHGAAHGGWAFGARYLIFILPLLLDSFFNGETRHMSNVWQGFLFGISFLFCTFPVMTFPFAPPEFTFPHNDFWRMLLLDGWYTPNLANIFGFRGIWSLVPAGLLLLCALLIVWQGMRRPRRFAYGLVAATAISLVYIFIPGLDNDTDRLRRATIEERFFRPGGRLDPFRAVAESRNDWKALRELNDAQWMVADAQAYAPDDFPYTTDSTPAESPAEVSRNVIDLQKKGRIGEAEALLKSERERMPLARCEFSTSLAVIYYSTNRKEEARTELESIQPLVNRASRPDCMRSQYLLGSLYLETGRPGDANRTFQAFLENTADSTDEELKGFLKQLKSK